ncbi:hypothetical protein NGTWS1803_08200 [Mycolicibacterium cyprinidarum]|nr:hypothetical protein NGTWS1803_08200 [Mycolicibacterium sp. NGTWS1803]
MVVVLAVFVAPPAAASKIPVLVVPRFNGGSVPVAGQAERFVTHRGFDPTQLSLGDSYQPISSALEANGYRDGVTLFTSTYDWRMPGAPEQLGTPDGIVTGLLSHWNDPAAADTFEYAVDYLRYWLIQAAEKNPGAGSVDVIAHSTGGSVVRAYLQSDAYGQTVLGPDGQPVRLPTIRRLILAAPPMEGAPFVWNLWNNNFRSFVGAPVGPSLIGSYAKAYQYVLDGGTITGPAGDITMASIAGSDPSTQQLNFLRAYNPLFRVVIPTYDFLLPPDATQPTNLDNDPKNNNNLLLDLNATSTPGNNPWARLVSKLYVTYPANVVVQGKPSQTALFDHTMQGPGGRVAPFTAFSTPNPVTTPTGVGESWYQEVVVPQAGDNAFPFRSMQGTFFDSTGVPDPAVTLQQWGNEPPPVGNAPIRQWSQTADDLSHNSFIAAPTIDQWIADQI